MSTNYPKGSMGEQDAKNQKVAAVIFVLGFIVLHALAIFIPAHVYTDTWNLVLTALAAAALLVLALMLWNNADLTEDSKVPHAIVIALAFASAVSLFYRPGL